MKASLKSLVCKGVATMWIFAAPLRLEARTDECPRLSIEGTDTVTPGGKVRLSAKIAPDSTKQPVDWMIVRENYRSKTVEVESFEKQQHLTIPIWNSNDSGLITAVAMASFSPVCQARAAYRVYVMENVGSPLLFDEYSKLHWNDERARLDVALTQIQNLPKFELLISLSFRAHETGSHRRQRISQILKHLVDYRKFDAKRITFLVSTEETTSVKIRPVQPDMIDVYASELDLVIPGEKFVLFEQLFRK